MPALPMPSGLGTIGHLAQTKGEYELRDTHMRGERYMNQRPIKWYIVI
jgi:hypothetical protein